MSTILEALKKSEQDRKLNKVPTLSSMQAPVEQSVWPLRLAVVSLLILGLVSIWVAFLYWSDKNQSNESGKREIILNNETVAAQTNIGTEDENVQIVVNVVSFAEEVNQRFVMINGRMYRQGDFVQAGLKVDEIRSDSVF